MFFYYLFINCHWKSRIRLNNKQANNHLHFKCTDLYPGLHSVSVFFTLQENGLHCRLLFLKISSLPIEAAAKAMIIQFPWLQPLDTAAIARQSQSADDIIKSATFPAAHAPSPDDSSHSESIWPYALSVLGTVGSRWACSPCCLLPVHQALCHSLTALISLQQRLYCISASLWPPAVFRVSAVFSFKVCLHWANMFFHFGFCLVILCLRCLFWTAT